MTERSLHCSIMLRGQIPSVSEYVENPECETKCLIYQGRLKLVESNSGEGFHAGQKNINSFVSLSHNGDLGFRNQSSRPLILS
jgi:hypothetical protein